MQTREQSLASLALGERGHISKLNSEGPNRRRMMDLGLVPGTEVQAIFDSPFGGVTAYLVRGTIIAIRSEDAQNIILK